MRPRTLFIIICLLVLAAPARAASRLEQIRSRGYLSCGIATTVAGFASLSAHGEVRGFEPDLCRAIAAVILGRAAAVHFVEVRSVQTFLRAQAPDVVARRLTDTLRREQRRGLRFSPVVFYDGAALLVRAADALDAASGLAGRRICLAAGGESEPAVAAYFQRQGRTVDLVPARSLDAAAADFAGGRCDALAADRSELAAIRAEYPDPAAFKLLPELLSKEPLALLVQGGDPQFSAVVRWTIYALIAAEELGVTQHTASANLEPADPEVRQLLGWDRGNGAALGLDERWASRAIEAVGNYGEIYARHLGAGTPLGLDRGANALWRDGGLMYALPLR